MNTSEIELVKENITDNIVFISGLTRSGKSILCPIISSFENTEKVNVNFFMEQIPFLEFLGKLPEDTSVHLLRAGMNLMVYDNSIGRNANFRLNDYTSVWKYKDPVRYIQRLFDPDKDSALDKINGKKSIFSMMVHNGLWHSDIWFKAFPKLKIIHMQRNPVEIAFSWMEKNYGKNFYSSVRANIVTFNYKGSVLPYYAHGWEDEYIGHSEMDRIIYMISKIRKFHLESYEKLSQNFKDRVLFVSHHEVATDPNVALIDVLKFIDTKYSSDTPRILSEERCPRIVIKDDLEKKKNIIKKASSSEAFDELMKIMSEFNSNPIAI